jgi:predicted phage gp36 major capsid-like protein
MRDIRNDLKDRANHIEEQINAAQADFERRLEQQLERLKSERDAKIAELKDELSAVVTLIDCEQRRLSGGMPAQPAEVQPLPLADFFLRRLSESGPLSNEDLRALAVKEGYFADSEIAARGVQAILLNIVKGGRIRQLPDGTFAPPSVMETLRLRRAG